VGPGRLTRNPKGGTRGGYNDLGKGNRSSAWGKNEAQASGIRTGKIEGGPSQPVGESHQGEKRGQPAFLNQKKEKVNKSEKTFPSKETFCHRERKKKRRDAAPHDNIGKREKARHLLDQENPGEEPGSPTTQEKTPFPERPQKSLPPGEGRFHEHLSSNRLRKRNGIT